VNSKTLAEEEREFGSGKIWLEFDKQQELEVVGGFAEGQMNYFEQSYSGFSIAACFSTFAASQAVAEPLISLAYPLNLEHHHEPVNKLFTKSM